MKALLRHLTRRYADRVPLGRRAPAAVPVPYLEEKDRFVGMWVAVKDGHVVAVAETSRGLVYELRKMGPKGAGAVAEFVRPASESYIVGAG